MELSFEDLFRFHSKIKMGGPDECWIWIAALRNGYGCIKIAKRVYDAHIVAYKIKHGCWPVNGVVMHTCDCRPCVNPKHLIDATYLDNIIDALNKGRHVIPHVIGEQNGSSRLTESEVVEIRRLYNETTLTLKEIAEIKMIGYSTVQDITSHKTWKHI
jgi:hypothetical protein